MTFSSRFTVITKDFLKRKNKCFFENIPAKKGTFEVKQGFQYHCITKLEVTEKEITIHLPEKKKLIFYISLKQFPLNLVTEILKNVTTISTTSPEKDLPRKIKCTQITKKGTKNKIVLTMNTCYYGRKYEDKSLTKSFNGFYYCNISKVQIINNNDKLLIVTFKSQRNEVYLFSSKENRDKFVKIVSLINAKYYFQNVKLGKIPSFKDFKFFKENGEVIKSKKIEHVLNIYHSSKVQKHVCSKMYFSKISENKKPIMLFLTKNFIVEYNTDLRLVMSKYPFSMIYKIVHYKKRYLIIEYEFNHPYVYQFESGKVFDEFLTSLLELCKRNKKLITVSTSFTKIESKINGRYIDPIVREYYFKTLSLIDTSGPDLNFKNINNILREGVDNLSLNVPSKVNKKIVVKLTQVLQIIQTNILSDEKTFYNEEIDVYKFKNRDVLECASLVIQFLVILITDKKFYASELLFDEKLVDLVYFFTKMENQNILGFHCFSFLRFCIDRTSPYKKETKEKNAKLRIVKPEKFFKTLLRYKIDIKENSLPLYMLLSLLDLCCFSSVSSTARELFSSIVEQVENNIDTLFFFMYFSKSCGIIYNSSVLIKVYLLEIQSNQVKFQKLRLNAMKSISFLQNFYVCVTTNDEIQIACSSDILGLLSEENAFAMELYKRMLPNSELLNELVRVEKDVVHFSTKIMEPKGKKLNLSSFPPPKVKKSWGRFVLSLRSRFTSIYLVWNDETRKELGKKLKKEINEFLKAQEIYEKSQVLVWNFDEFKVNYSCLKDEPIVGNYFIKYIQEVTNNTIILDPFHFMEQLHHELLFSDEHTIICLKGCTAVYSNYKKRIGVYPFMKNLCLFIETKIQNDKMIIIETLNFLLALFSLEKNIHNFIKYNGIEILIPYLDCIYDDIELKQKGVMIVDSKIDKTSINVRITKLCVEILIILVSFRLCVNRNRKVLVPIPVSIRKMCTTEIITKLTQFLLIQDEEMFSKTIQLLTHLSSNENILVKLYDTGFFFFVFLGENDFYPIVKIISKVNLHQNVKLKEYFTGGKRDYSPYIQSALNGILPREIIYQISTIRELSKRKKENCILRISEVLSADRYESPRFIWNKKMRKTLRSQIHDYLFKFFDEIKKVNYKGGQRNIDLIKKIINREQIRVNYPNLQNELVCNHYYLRNFIKMSTWEKDFAFELKNDKVEMLKLLNSMKIVLRKRFDEKENISMCIKALLLLFQINQNVFVDFHTEIDGIIKYLNELMFSKSKVDDNQVVSIFQSLWFLDLVFKKSFKKIEFSKVLNLTLQIITHLNGVMNVKKVDTLDKRLQKIQKNRKKKINEYNLSGLSFDEKLYEIILLCLKIIKFFTSYLFKKLSSDFENSAQLILKNFLHILKLPFEKSIDLKETIVSIFQYFISSRKLQEKIFIKGGIILFLLMFIAEDKDLARRCVRIFQKVCGFVKRSGVVVNDKIKKVIQNLFPIRDCFTSKNYEDKRGKTPRDLQLGEVKKSFNDKMDKELKGFLKLEIKKLGSNYSLKNLVNFKYKLLKNEIQSNGVFLKLFNLYKKEKQKSCVGKEFILGVLKLVKECKKDKTKLKIVIECLYNSTEFKRISKYFKSIEKDEEFSKILVSCLDISDTGLFLFTLKVIMNFSQLELNKTLFKLLIDNKLFEIYKKILFSKTKNTFHDWCRDVIILSLYNLTTILKNDEYIDKFSVFLVFFLKVIFKEMFSKQLSKQVSILLSTLIVSNSTIEKECIKFLPNFIVKYFKEYPLIIVQILNRDFCFPEFIWNQQLRNKVKNELGNLDVNDKTLTEIEYNLPYSINGVFLSIYIEKKDYPVRSFETFVPKLIESLKENVHVSLTLLALQNALGGEKYINRVNLLFFKEKTKEFLDFVLKNKDDQLYIVILRIFSKLVLDDDLLKDLQRNYKIIFNSFAEILKKEDKECYRIISQILLKFFFKNEELCKKIDSNSPLFQCLIRFAKKKKDPRIGKVLRVVFNQNEELRSEFEEEPIFQLFIIQIKEIDEKTMRKWYRIRDSKVYSGNVLHYMKIEYNEKKYSNEKTNLFVKSKIIPEKHRKTLRMLNSPSEKGRNKPKSFSVSRNHRRSTKEKKKKVVSEPFPEFSKSLQVPKRSTPKRSIPTPEAKSPNSINKFSDEITDVSDLSDNEEPVVKKKVRDKLKKKPRKRLPSKDGKKTTPDSFLNSDDDFVLSDDDSDDIISGEEEVLPEELNLDDYKEIIEQEKKNEEKNEKKVKRKKTNSSDYPDPFASDEEEDEKGFDDPYL